MKGITEIKIEECLDAKWQDCFENTTIQYRGNTTILLVSLKDQAHLHGILNFIRDLNLKLISINTLGKD